MIFYLANETARKRAIQAVAEAPDGYRVTISEPKRTLDQNAKFHAICTDLAKSDVTWAGKRRTLDEWKALIVSGHAVATKQGGEVIPGIEGEFVAIRESTASMTKARSASLIEYTLAFCAANGVDVHAEHE